MSRSAHSLLQDNTNDENEETCVNIPFQGVTQLPPLRMSRPKSAFKGVLRRSSSSSTSSSNSSPQEVLHMSSECDHMSDNDGEPDLPPQIKTTKSNLCMIPEEDSKSGDDNDKFGLPFGPQSQPRPSFKGDFMIDSNNDGRRPILQFPTTDNVKFAPNLSLSGALPSLPGTSRQSFAGYHKCRKRSMSLPQNKVTPDISNFEDRFSTSERNLHRTQSGLGLVGDQIAEEELTKSKILSLFEADISSSKIKTYYNGVVGVLADRQRHDKIIQEDKIFIVHPLSTFRLIWDTVLLLAIFLMMIILPVKLSFFKIFHSTDRTYERKHWYPLIILIDVIFLFDVVLSFFTGTVEQKVNPPRINLDRKEIRLRYLKSWFIIDLIASIPFDIIGTEISGQPSVDTSIAAGASALLGAKILKIFSLFRVLRLGRLHFILKRWIQIFELSPLIIKIFQLLGFFFMIAHWSACLQFFVVYLRNFPEKSWPVLLKIQDASIWDQYLWSVFRSLSHMITIGYGRDPPQETLEVLLIIPSMLIGAFFYMMIVSQMTKTISMFKIGDIRYTEKLKDVDELAKKFNLNNDVHQRMHEFFHHTYGGAILDSDKIIKELPLALKIDVIKSMQAELLDNVFFLQSACDGFLEQFLLSATSSVFMTGDIVIRSEDSIENLYVITKGTVSIEFTTTNITLQDEIIVRKYGFFGELPMLLKRKADMMVYAETPCDFLLIPKFIFHSLVDRYSIFKHQMLLVAHSRIVLQGIDPRQLAPDMDQAFEEAICDKRAVKSTEDILELASQSRLDPDTMEQFRSRNIADFSVFRKIVAHQKGEKPPSEQTPIYVKQSGYPERFVEPKDQSIHLSVSIHDDRISTRASESSASKHETA